MKKIEVEVYQFDELDDAAKEKAREWYRGTGLPDEWWSSTYDDAAQIGLNITEFDLDRNRNAKGHFTMPAAHVADAIIANHGDQTETYKTAQKFIADVKEAEKKYYDASGNCTDDDALNDLQDKMDAEFLKSILEDYSIMLQKEYEYLYSDESVDENVRANEYEFTKEGKRFVV